MKITLEVQFNKQLNESASVKSTDTSTKWRHDVIAIPASRRTECSVDACEASATIKPDKVKQVQNQITVTCTAMHVVATRKTTSIHCDHIDNTSHVHIVQIIKLKCTYANNEWQYG